MLIPPDFNQIFTRTKSVFISKTFFREIIPLSLRNELPDTKHRPNGLSSFTFLFAFRNTGVE